MNLIRNVAATNVAGSALLAGGAFLLGSSGQVGAQGSSSGSTLQMQVTTSCARRIQDHSSPGNCIPASSFPVPGTLLPLGNYFFVDGAGNVGIGTTSPSQKLDVLGNVRLIGGGNGIIFPDGTIQTSAVVGGGGGIPSGFMILGDTTSSPSGYSLAGSLSVPEGWGLKTPAPTNRNQLPAASVDGKIYVIGGVLNGYSAALSTVEEYDPASDSWATRAQMQVARYNLASAVLDGKIYAIGGYGGIPLQPLAVVEEYDPSTDTWTPKSSMPTARFSLTAAAVNGKIYAIGGHNGNVAVGTVEEGASPRRLDRS